MSLLTNPPYQLEIEGTSVAKARELSPRRVCFEAHQKNALKRRSDQTYVGSFSLPFMDSVGDLFLEETGYELFQSKAHPGVWRSIHSEEEYKNIENWVRAQGSRVFLRDCLACSVALGPYFNESGDQRTEIGELEHSAKYSENSESIENISSILVNTISSLPFYNAATSILAVPPTPNKDFDLPTSLVESAAKQLGIDNLSSALAWQGAKPSMKEVAVERKWETLETVGMVATQDAFSNCEAVILIDDLYQSGVTMQFVAASLLKEGVDKVLGLSVVKSRRDSDNGD